MSEQKQQGRTVEIDNNDPDNIRVTKKQKLSDGKSIITQTCAAIIDRNKSIMAQSCAAIVNHNNSVEKIIKACEDYEIKNIDNIEQTDNELINVKKGIEELNALAKDSEFKGLDIAPKKSSFSFSPTKIVDISINSNFGKIKYENNDIFNMIITCDVTIETLENARNVLRKLLLENNTQKDQPKKFSDGQSVEISSSQASSSQLHPLFSFGQSKSSPTQSGVSFGTGFSFGPKLSSTQSESSFNFGTGQPTQSRSSFSFGL